MLKCHLSREHQLQWQKFINVNSEGNQKIDMERSKRELQGLSLERFMSCRHFIMLLGELQIQQNIKTGYLQAGQMRVCDFCTHYTICGHQPHDSSVLWQRLRGAPVYQNDLFYPCSFIVKSKWLLSNFIDAPVSDFPRSNLLGVLWAFRCPLPFAQPVSWSL